MCSDLDSRRLIILCNRLYKFRGPKTAGSSFTWEVWWWKCGQIPAQEQDRKREESPTGRRSNRELRRTETQSHIPLPSQVFSRNWTICSLMELCLESYLLNKKCVPLRQSFSEPVQPSNPTFRNPSRKNHVPFAFYFASWFFGLILFSGCTEPSQPPAPTNSHQSLTRSK